MLLEEEGEQCPCLLLSQTNLPQDDYAGTNIAAEGHILAVDVRMCSWGEESRALPLLIGSSHFLVLSPESLLIQENQSHIRQRRTGFTPGQFLCDYLIHSWGWVAQTVCNKIQTKSKDISDHLVTVQLRKHIFMQIDFLVETCNLIVLLIIRTWFQKETNSLQLPLTSVENKI